MNNPFVKEQVITNYLIIALFSIIIIIANSLYGGSVESWSKSIALLLIVAVALLIKNKKIKSSSMELDERLQLITYRAMSTGFYFMLGAMFWFLIKDMVLTGQVTLRTIIVLLAGLAGYLGDFLISYKKV